MQKINVNGADFKTFSYLKANETEIEIPDIVKNDFYEKSDNFSDKLDTESFKGGISKEALILNKKYRNLYKIWTAKSEKSEKYTLKLKTNSDYPYLFDRHDIISEENAHLTVILDYRSENTETFRNSVIYIKGEKNSETNVFIIQKEDKKAFSLESIIVVTEDNAKVDVCQYELGAGKFYGNCRCNLTGRSSKANINSIYLGRNDDIINLSYNVTHMGEKSDSHILINGALKDHADKMLKSNLDFKKGAKKAKGTEEEYTVLLDDSVLNLSVPLMLCREDDVEGNHAASAGKIDENTLFYIMSRGFSIEDAQALIIESKFAGAIDKIEDKKIERELRETVLERMK